MTSESLKDSLKAIKYPGFNRDIVSFGLVKTCEYHDGHAHIDITVTTADLSIEEKLKSAIATHLKTLPEIQTSEIKVEILPHKSAQTATQMPKHLSQVKHVIAIASGKGGVGKSTFTTHFACALSQILEKLGKKNAVGIMDADIYGPSIPLMLGIHQRPEVTENHELIPLENFGIKAMSMGLLIDETAPVVWRGPMITKTIQQFADSVAWGPLEVLLIDLPPGTGDAHLTLVQTIPLTGVIILTTPQAAAYEVALRGAMMFPKMNVPYLGVVENMSYFEEPTTHQRLCLFGEGGGELVAQALKTPLLGQIPIDPQIRQSGDFGIPIIISHPESSTTQTINKIAQTIIDQLNKSQINS